MGIMIGCLVSMAPRRRSDISSCAMRSMIAGNIACFLTACIAGETHEGLGVHYCTVAIRILVVIDSLEKFTVRQKNGKAEIRRCFGSSLSACNEIDWSEFSIVHLQSIPKVNTNFFKS